MKVHPTRKFDNTAKKYQHIQALPLAAAMGAEIRGIDISTITEYAREGFGFLEIPGG